MDPFYDNCLENGVSSNRWQAIIGTIIDPIHWRINAVQRGDELNESCIYFIPGNKNLHIKLKNDLIRMYSTSALFGNNQVI